MFNICIVNHNPYLYYRIPHFLSSTVFVRKSDVFLLNTRALPFQTVLLLNRTKKFLLFFSTFLMSILWKTEGIIHFTPLHFMFLCVKERFCFFYYDSTQCKQCDHIRNCHQTIEDICNGPYSTYCHVRSAKYCENI